MNPQFNNKNNNKTAPSSSRGGGGGGASDGELAGGENSSRALDVDSQLELSRAAMLEKAAVSFLSACPAALETHTTRAHDAAALRRSADGGDVGAVFNPLTSIRRHASAAVSGAASPSRNIETYGCLWCARLGALVRKKIALQSRQWCQNVCLVLTCALTIVVLIVFNSVISDQISLVGDTSSSTDTAASVTVVVPSLPSLLLLNEMALQPSAYVCVFVLPPCA